MAIYRIEMMTQGSYSNYMDGGYRYGVDYYDVEANSIKEALAKAHEANPTMVLHENYVKTLDELEQERIEQERYYQEYLEREAKAKAKKEANLKAKAEAAGMTVSEYKTFKNRERRIRAIKNEISEMENELARKKAVLEELEAKQEKVRG